MIFVRRLLRALSGGLFALAIVALAWLLLPDLWIGFHPSLRHHEAGALALMFVGSSFICMQLSARGQANGMLKGLLLGLAFVLWGGDQFLPPGTAATAIDSVVIAIFVVDLGLVIATHLEAPHRAARGESRE
jgi:hypothetical protein